MHKAIHIIGIGVLAIAAIFVGLAFWGQSKTLAHGADFSDTHKRVTIIENGLSMTVHNTTEQTVGSLLSSQNISYEPEDYLFPESEAIVHDGDTIILNHAKNIDIVLGEESYSIQTHAHSAQELIWEENITLGPDDFILPSEDSILNPGDVIEIVRVRVENESEYEAIPFKTLVEEDEELGWREQKIVQNGLEGKKELEYKVVYHNNEIVKKSLTNTKILEKPRDKKIVKGTYVKLGKKHTGLGTWYAHTGTLAAASPWLPMGSYAKVTNEENGKSVIVKINDRGPFGDNRIIDLDKVAFEKIASLGSGVVNVKVEEVLN